MYINMAELHAIQNVIEELELRDDIPYIMGMDVKKGDHNEYSLYSASDWQNPVHRVRARWVEGGSRFGYLEEIPS